MHESQTRDESMGPALVRARPWPDAGGVPWRRPGVTKGDPLAAEGTGRRIATGVGVRNRTTGKHTRSIEAHLSGKGQAIHLCGRDCSPGECNTRGTWRIESPQPQTGGEHSEVHGNLHETTRRFWSRPPAAGTSSNTYLQSRGRLRRVSC